MEGHTTPTPPAPKPPMPAAAAPPKPAVPNATRTPKSATSYTVACKLPNGIMLQLHREEMVRVPVLGGGIVMEKQSRPSGDPIKVFGNRAPFGEQPRAPVVASYALTHNVPADHWEQWLRENADSSLVRERIIFAYPTADEAIGVAKENKAVLSGLEPLNMGRIKKGDKSIPKDPRLQALARITTATTKDADEE